MVVANVIHERLGQGEKGPGDCLNPGTVYSTHGAVFAFCFSSSSSFLGPGLSLFGLTFLLLLLYII